MDSDQRPAAADAAADNKRFEWKKRLQWTIFVLLFFVIMALAGSAIYQSNRGPYSPVNAFRDLGFEVNGI